MKIIVDLDPKLQRKLEAIAAAKGRNSGELAAELLTRVLGRDASSSSSSAEGIPSPVAVVKPVAVAAPDPQLIVSLLEVLISRFRLSDQDGSQRRACLSELQMVGDDPVTVQIMALLSASLK